MTEDAMNQKETERQTKIVAIGNQKGGVGKTSNV